MCLAVCDELEGSEAWGLLARSPSDQIPHISCQCFSFHITQERRLLTGKCAHEPSADFGALHLSLLERTRVKGLKEVGESEGCRGGNTVEEKSKGMCLLEYEELLAKLDKVFACTSTCAVRQIYYRLYYCVKNIVYLFIIESNFIISIPQSQLRLD